MDRYQIALGKTPVGPFPLERRRLSVIGGRATGKTNYLIDKAIALMSEEPEIVIGFTAPPRILPYLIQRVSHLKRVMVERIDVLHRNNVDAIFCDDIDGFTEHGGNIIPYLINDLDHIPIIVITTESIAVPDWPMHYLTSIVQPIVNRNNMIFDPAALSAFYGTPTIDSAASATYGIPPPPEPSQYGTPLTQRALESLRRDAPAHYGSEYLSPRELQQLQRMQQQTAEEQERRRRQQNYETYRMSGEDILRADDDRIRAERERRNLTSGWGLR